MYIILVKTLSSLAASIEYMKARSNSHYYSSTILLVVGICEMNTIIVG